VRVGKISVVCSFLLLLVLSCTAAEINEARTFQLQGKPRQYFLFAPDKTCARGAAPAPVVLLHHGTGGNGSELIAAWRDLARRQHIILVAPTGTGPYGWIAPQDGPELHRLLTADVNQRCAGSLDMRRIYAVGFSNGGDFAFYVALAESKYFAGAAILSRKFQIHEGRSK